MLYRDKYRIPSARWVNWDYTRAAWYFVTVCTKDMERFFGEVVGGETKLSGTGKIVAEEWLKTSQIRPGVELDEWQVMPNHFHGILHILDVETARRAVSTKEMPPPAVSEKETFHRNVSTRTPHRETPHRGVSTLKANSPGAIVGQFKAACTRRIWAAGHSRFAWQTRFFDRLIRTPGELDKIRAYIRHNPLVWDREAGTPANLEL